MSDNYGNNNYHENKNYCDIQDGCKLLKEKDEEIKKLKELLIEKEEWTGLYDTCGNKIYIGNIVHWTDGGDDLPLEARIKTRWDRIAVVEKNGIETSFKVIDSPSQSTKEYAARFNYGSFIYTETEKYLTVVAKNKQEYFKKFKNAGECMAYVLEVRNDFSKSGTTRN